ncbi:MAG: hypothetical protein KAT47_02165 [Candidatus Aegiribacteria sp.]|nr:hypothetical protein [Candidatus Aegiribacteria sp.]
MKTEKIRVNLKIPVFPYIIYLLEGFKDLSTSSIPLPLTNNTMNSHDMSKQQMADKHWYSSRPVGRRIMQASWAIIEQIDIIKKKYNHDILLPAQLWQCEY